MRFRFVAMRPARPSALSRHQRVHQVHGVAEAPPVLPWRVMLVIPRAVHRYPLLVGQSSLLNGKGPGQCDHVTRPA
jgi:hypothetical protein